MSFKINLTIAVVNKGHNKHRNICIISSAKKYITMLTKQFHATFLYFKACNCSLVLWVHLPSWNQRLHTQHKFTSNQAERQFFPQLNRPVDKEIK